MCILPFPSCSKKPQPFKKPNLSCRTALSPVHWEPLNVQPKTVLWSGFKTDEIRQRKFVPSSNSKHFMRVKALWWQSGRRYSASKEQNHSQQGLQWPGSQGCSGEGICLHLFSCSSMRTRHSRHLPLLILQNFCPRLSQSPWSLCSDWAVSYPELPLIVTLTKCEHWNVFWFEDKIAHRFC